MSKRIVIALGGNALGNTPYEQLALVTETAKPIVDLIAQGNEVIIAHGNGPQVGMINLGMSTAAEAKAIKSDMPFPECGAMSQGYIGYHLQNAIGNELAAMSVMEMTTSFAQEMAVKATGKPVEFFKLMPRGKIKKVQAAVIKGMDNSENANEVKKQLESHTLKFAAPYTYEGSEKAELKGKTFDSIDLSGVGELNTMSESMAESRMAAGGFAPVNTHRNYLYCCIIASMGTGYPVDFFAGLPLCEAVKLRDAINSDFFE